MEALKVDWRTAALDDLDAALCDLAERLTREPAGTTEHDIERLRDLGLDDRGIFDAVHIISYYNYVNRLADGLGVELEVYWEGQSEPPEFSATTTDDADPEE